MSALEEENAALRAEVAALRARLGEAEAAAAAARAPQLPPASAAPPSDVPKVMSVDEACALAPLAPVTSLSAARVARYSRQLLMPEFGPAAQMRLLSARVLVVGAGGLGAAALLYLAGAGVGRLAAVDDDHVETTNLHRQVIHSERTVGLSKVESAARRCRALNSDVEFVPVRARFCAANARRLAAAFDVVVDCTDNAETRYLVNDACVLEGRPLVSGAAVGMDGQLSVYGAAGGPCYRCLHPTPPPADAAQSCSDAGVLGGVPGAIGVLQAVEAIKVAARVGEALVGRLLVWDACDARLRVVRLRGRRPSCAVCGDSPTITSVRDSEGAGAACGLPAAPAAAVPEVDVRALADARRANPAAVALIDVRVPVQFSICSLEGAVSVPLSRLSSERTREAALRSVREAQQRAAAAAGGDAGDAASGGAGDDATDATTADAAGGAAGGGAGGARGGVFVLCRRGVDSVAATALLRAAGVPAVNVRGGLLRWTADVDPKFPMY